MISLADYSIDWPCWKGWRDEWLWQVYSGDPCGQTPSLCIHRMDRTWKREYCGISKQGLIRLTWLILPAVTLTRVSMTRKQCEKEQLIGVIDSSVLSFCWWENEKNSGMQIQRSENWTSIFVFYLYVSLEKFTYTSSHDPCGGLGSTG